MPFRGDDPAFIARLQAATAATMLGLEPVPYTPFPVSAAQFPEILEFSPDMPPDPRYLGSTRVVMTGEYFRDTEELGHFQMWLWNSESGRLIYTDELTFDDIEEADSYLPAMLRWTFSQIPAEPEAVPAAPEPAPAAAAAAPAVPEAAPAVAAAVPAAPEPTPAATAAAPAASEPAPAVATAAPADPEPAPAVAAAAPADPEPAPSRPEEAGASEKSSSDTGETNSPLNRRLYFGLRAGGAIGSYFFPNNQHYESNASVSFSYEAAVSVAIRFLPWLRLQVEAVFVSDTAIFRAGEFLQTSGYGYLRYSDEYTYYSLMVPVVFKFPFTFSPMPVLVSPYGGAYFAAPLGMAAKISSNPGGEGIYAYTFQPPIGFIVGLEAGKALGPGLIFLDLRLSADLGQTVIQNGFSYSRSRITLSLGYQFSFF